MAAVHARGTVCAPRVSTARRRAQLTSIAAARFYELGYRRVALADIANEVGMTAPAVYRHFRSKEALLAAAISSGVDVLEEALARVRNGSLDELMTQAAHASLERPDLWVLVQRESRFLTAESKAQIRARVARVTDTFVSRLQRERPTLSLRDARFLATAASSVLSAPPISRNALPRETYHRELTAAALAALRVDLCAVRRVGSPPAGPTRPAMPYSRRSEIVEAAVDLIFRHGYDVATLDDIGAAVGIAGPSLYHHFETKMDILVTAFEQAAIQLQSDRRCLAGGGATADLDSQIRSYIRFCLRNRALVGAYVSEMMHLPPAAQRNIRAIIRQGVTDWTAALLRVEDSIDESVANTRVRGALGAIHDLVRLGRLYTRPRIVAEIEAIARAVLLQG